MYHDRNKFDGEKDIFLLQGMLTQDLLSCIWKPCRLNGKAVSLFLDLLASFSLYFSAKSKDDKTFYQFPWFLKNSPPRFIINKVKQPCHFPHIKLVIEYRFDFCSTDNFYEKCSVRLHRHLKSKCDFRKDTKNSVYARIHRIDVVLYLDIDILFLGLICESKDIAECVDLRNAIHEDIKTELENYPGAICSLSIMCPRCLMLDVDNKERHYFQDMTLKDVHKSVECRKQQKQQTHHQHTVPSALMCSFPKYSDLNKKLKKFVDDWMESMKSIAVRGPDMPPTSDSNQLITEKKLRQVSRKLSTKDIVTTVALELGFTYDDIKAELTNNGGLGGSITTVAFNLLTDWKKKNALTSKEDNVKALKNALIESGRLDIVEECLMKSG